MEGVWIEPNVTPHLFNGRDNFVVGRSHGERPRDGRSPTVSVGVEGNTKGRGDVCGEADASNLSLVQKSKKNVTNRPTRLLARVSVSSPRALSCVGEQLSTGRYKRVTELEQR